MLTAFGGCDIFTPAPVFKTWFRLSAKGLKAFGLEPVMRF
ncbi:hypothetical protein X474_24910 [Dethiosulfatarculus sandiegensis]|uniref:Uncharacterized protein n=1 Tax=Dethiosulfatarculus sandiegensis TaxID=1429043 RepID=A0A0D2J7B4_9BACT|nr:hypothetical protein X474_24910 [Dethiosulfatarculus sandiegensis]